MKNILTLANRYASFRGLSPRYVAKMATGDNKLFLNLAAGATITVRRAAKIVQWFSNNWPVDCVWPFQIPRPPPSPDSPAGRLQTASSASDLGPDGKIKNIAHWCRQNAYDQAETRYVIKNYGAGGKLAGRAPRRDTAANFVFHQLVKSGDVRFAEYRRQDKIAAAAGLR